MKSGDIAKFCLVSALSTGLILTGSAALGQTSTASAAPAASDPRAAVEAQIKAAYDALASGDIFEAMRLAEAGLIQAEQTNDLRLEERMILIKAAFFRRQSKPAQAETFLRERLASDKWKVGTNQRAGIALSLAGAILEQGRIEEGAAYLEAEKPTFFSEAVPNNTKANYYGTLGAALVGLKKFEEAGAAMVSYAEMAEASLGVTNPRVAEAWEAAGASAEFLKNERLALDRYKRAVDLAKPLMPAGNLQIARHEMNYARMAIALRQPALANEISAQALSDQYTSWRRGYGLPRNITALEQRIFVTHTDVLLKAMMQQEGDTRARRTPATVDRALFSIQNAAWAGQALANEEIIEKLGQNAPLLSAQLERVRAASDANATQQAIASMGSLGAGLQPGTITASQIQSKLSRDEAVIALYDGVDETHVVLITKSRSEWRTLAVTRNAMCARIAVLRASLAENSPLVCSDENAERFSVATTSNTATPSAQKRAFARTQAFELYRDTIGAFGSSLNNIKKLTILPLGSFGAVPWAALPTSSPTGPDDDHAAVAATNWAINRFELTLVSSLSRFANQPQPGRPASNKLVFGFGSDEAQTRQATSQATEINGLVGLGTPQESKAFWGPVQVRAQLNAPVARDVAALIVSAHGLVVENGAKRDTGVLLSLSANVPDQTMTTSDVLSSNLRARLVILAACDMAITNGQPSGDAFGPLISSFGARGAKAILAPIAPLPDVNSIAFTRPVLASFLAGQENIAQSLRQSQLAWLRANRGTALQSPTYWAAYSAIVP